MNQGQNSLCAKNISIHLLIYLFFYLHLQNDMNLAIKQILQ